MIHTERKKLNVVDILVSLNFMHMKMCSSFFSSIVAMKIHHRLAFLSMFLLQILISRSLCDLLWFFCSFYSFKLNFSTQLWLVFIFPMNFILLFFINPENGKYTKRKFARICSIARKGKFLLCRWILLFSSQPFNNLQRHFPACHQLRPIDGKMTLKIRRFTWSRRENSSTKDFSLRQNYLAEIKIFT